MLLLLRKSLFYLLAAAYLVITPYLIFYGLGYSVDPAEGEIYKTGLVSIVTEPKGATVFLEARKYSGKTPAAIGGLLPGQYHLRLALKGFEPWQKTIEIVAEKATRLEPVVLLPHKIQEEKVAEGTFKDILPKGSDFKIFAQEGKTLGGLVKIELFFRKKFSLHPPLKATAPIRILEEKMIPDSSTVLFKTETNEKKGWLLYDLEREKVVADLTPWIPEKVDLIDWDPKKPDFVYFLKKGQITVVDLEAQKASPFGLETPHIIGMGARHRRLYFLTKDLNLWQSHAQGRTPLTEKEGFQRKFYSHSDNHLHQIELMRHVFFQRELFLFLGDNGSLMSSWPPYQLAEKNVVGFLHSENGDSEKILYWTDKQISVLDFALKNNEEESLPPQTLLYRSGRNIRQAFWAFDNTHVLFVDEDEIFLLEAGETSPYQVRSLGKIARGTRIFYSDRQHAIYRIDPHSWKLLRRKISE